MDIGFSIPPACCSSAPTSSIALKEKSQLQKSAQSGTFSRLFKGLAQDTPDEKAPSNIERSIPQSDLSAAQPSSSTLVEKGPFTQLAQDGAFSALLNGQIQNTPGEEPPSSSDSNDPTGSTALGDAQAQAAMVSVMGAAPASNPAVEDDQVPSSVEADCAEPGLNDEHSSPQRVEGISFTFQDVGAQVQEAESTGQDGITTEAAPLTTGNLPGHPAPQPLVNPGQSDDAPVMTPNRTASRTTDESPFRNGRGAPVDLPPAFLIGPTGSAVLPGTPPPGSLNSDQWPSPGMENQGSKNPLPVTPVNGDAQSLNRPSTDVQPSAKVPEQGIQAATSLGQSLSASVMGESGEGGDDPFGTDAQGTGEGTSFHFGEKGSPESVIRGIQSPLFNGQFTSAQHAQLSPQGEQAPVVAPMADHLKLTQAFLGEDHSATITSASGKAQVVHVELSSHDSGPLSVRIAMMDQTVHTQFTTDRNDLGAILIARQDQLQQNLTKSGLELGQFQVQIDQRGQQESLPDRQARRNGGEPEPQPSSQGHNQQAQDREGPNHRPPRALSLFA